MAGARDGAADGVGRARDELRYHVEQVDGLEDQVGLAQSELAQATTDVERLKVSVANGAGQIETDKAKLEKLKLRLEETAAKIAAENAVTEKLDKTAAEKEQDRLAEIKRLKALEDEIAQLRNTIFKQSQEASKASYSYHQSTARIPQEDKRCAGLLLIRNCAS